jgi:hypothetical protein
MEIKNAASKKQLRTGVPCEGTGCCRTMNPQLSIPQAIHYTNENFRALKRMYRVIHKSFRDFRPLRYSSREGHAEGEHVNRGRDTPNFCPTLQVLYMSTLVDAADSTDYACFTNGGSLIEIGL